MLDSGLKATLAASSFAPSAAVASGAGSAKIPARKFDGLGSCLEAGKHGSANLRRDARRLLLAVHRSL